MDKEDVCFHLVLTNNGPFLLHGQVDVLPLLLPDIKLYLMICA